MTTSERRLFPRLQSAVEFFCYIDGDRFDSVSVDISPSGVFLATTDAIRKGAIVMLVPKKEGAKNFPVMLIGRVVRKQVPPEVAGYGVQWLRCLSRQGLDAVYRFIANYPEFSQLTLPFPTDQVAASPVVGYDFQTNRFYVPDIPGMGSPIPAPSPAADILDARVPQSSSRPVQGTVTRPPDSERVVLKIDAPGFSRGAESGAVTRALRQLHEQVPVAVTAQLLHLDVEYPARLRMLSLVTLYVEVSGHKIPVNAAVSLRLPVPHHGFETMVTLACSVHSTRCHAALPGIEGLHLTIESTDEGRRHGLFERYAKYLYYQMIAAE